MHIRRFHCLACLLLLSLIIDISAQNEGGGPVPVWSKEATSISFERGARKADLSSPDHMNVVTIDGTNISVSKQGKELSGLENTGIDTLAELLWAPDSAAFAITSSDGGGIGTWNVRVFVLKENAVQNVDIASQVRADFKTRFKCQDAEEPNLAAFKWLGASSSQLIVIGEVPPHSSCRQMGRIAGYDLSLPSGRILRRYSGSELREQWGQILGQRILNARDLP